MDLYGYWLGLFTEATKLRQLLNRSKHGYWLIIESCFVCSVAERVKAPFLRQPCDHDHDRVI